LLGIDGGGELIALVERDRIEVHLVGRTQRAGDLGDRTGNEGERHGCRQRVGSRGDSVTFLLPIRRAHVLPHFFQPRHNGADAGITNRTPFLPRPAIPILPILDRFKVAGKQLVDFPIRGSQRKRTEFRKHEAQPQRQSQRVVLRVRPLFWKLAERLCREPYVRPALHIVFQLVRAILNDLQEARPLLGKELRQAMHAGDGRRKFAAQTERIRHQHIVPHPHVVITGNAIRARRRRCREQPVLHRQDRMRAVGFERFPDLREALRRILLRNQILQEPVLGHRCRLPACEAFGIHHRKGILSHPCSSSVLSQNSLPIAAAFHVIPGVTRFAGPEESAFVLNNQAKSRFLASLGMTI